MQPRDLPPDRSLDPSPDGMRDAPRGPDGRARPPDELLDNLRLRLRDLPGNHPSALRDPDPVAPRDVELVRREADDANDQRPGPPEADAPEPGEGDAASKDSRADAQVRDRASLADLIRAISDTSDGMPWSADGFLAG